MQGIGEDHIKLADVIILDHFLQRYTLVRSPIHEFRQLAQSTLRNQKVELGCRKSFFKNILLTDNFIVTVYYLSYICGKKHLHKWRESGHYCNIT